MCPEGWIIAGPITHPFPPKLAHPDAGRLNPISAAAWHLYNCLWSGPSNTFPNEPKRGKRSKRNLELDIGFCSCDQMCCSIFLHFCCKFKPCEANSDSCSTYQSSKLFGALFHCPHIAFACICMHSLHLSATIHVQLPRGEQMIIYNLSPRGLKYS